MFSLLAPQQKVIIYRNFPPKVSRECTNVLLPNLFSENLINDNRQLLTLKKSSRGRLVCWVKFQSLTFYCILPLPVSFLNVCFPPTFAVALKQFIPQTNSEISSSANSNKIVPYDLQPGLECCTNEE